MRRFEVFAIRTLWVCSVFLSCYYLRMQKYLSTASVLSIALVFSACTSQAPIQSDESVSSMMETSSSSISSVAKEAVSSVGMQTYVNQELHFSILHPVDWSVVDLTSGGPQAIGFASPESADDLVEPWDWTVTIIPKNAQINSIENYLKRNGNRPPNEIRRNISIQGRDAVLLEIPFAASNSINKTVYVESKDSIFVMYGHVFSEEEITNFENFYTSFEVIE